MSCNPLPCGHPVIGCHHQALAEKNFALKTARCAWSHSLPESVNANATGAAFHPHNRVAFACERECTAKGTALIPGHEIPISARLFSCACSFLQLTRTSRLRVSKGYRESNSPPSAPQSEVQRKTAVFQRKLSYIAGIPQLSRSNGTGESGLHHLPDAI
jgi:hypothetical protein